MDAYDHMVAYLTERPEEIETAWTFTMLHRCGRLFAFVEPEPFNATATPSGKQCGCLTMIRFDPKVFGAWTDDLSEAIQNDERIPGDTDDIDQEVLCVLAGWQRRIDAALNRTPPVWHGAPCAKPEVEMAAAEVEQLA